MHNPAKVPSPLSYPLSYPPCIILPTPALNSSLVSFASCLLFFMFFMFMRKTLPSSARCALRHISFYVFRWELQQGEVGVGGEEGESARWELCQQSSWRDCIVCLLASSAVAVAVAVAVRLFAFWFMLLVFYAIFIFYAALPTLTPALLLRLGLLLLPLHPLAILKDLHS